jgi:hypothetical protein
MKRIYSLITCFFILTLVASATAARAQGQGSEDKSEAQVRSAASYTFSHLSLYRAELSLDPAPWVQTSTLVDGSGGAHTAFYTEQSIYYAYCPAGCANLANWSETSIADAGSSENWLDHPALALDASNRPRMMWYIDPNYFYAECNANCTNAANWTAVQVPVAADQSYIFPQSGRYFTLDTQGHPRFTCYGYDSDNENVYRGFAYTTCDGNCTTASNWHSTLIDIGDYVRAPQLILNTNDQPRIMGVYMDVNLIYNLVYMGCDANCTQSGNWQFTTLYEVGEFGNFSFRLDSQGRPRLAFYNESPSDPMMYYAWSNSNNFTSAGWSIDGVNLPSNDQRTVDLAIDSQDRPRVVFASSEENQEYAECTADCETTGATWQVQHIETGSELDISDPIPPGSNCISSEWKLRGYPSLALDAADKPSVSYYARHEQLCQGGGGYTTLHDVSALRFATVGGATQNSRLIYLPLITR